MQKRVRAEDDKNESEEHADNDGSDFHSEDDDQLRSRKEELRKLQLDHAHRGDELDDGGGVLETR